MAAKTANSVKAAILTSIFHKDELNASIEVKRREVPTSKLQSLKGKGFLIEKSVKKIYKSQKKVRPKRRCMMQQTRP